MQTTKERMFAEGIRADPNKQIVLSYVGFLSFENHKICPCFFWHLGASWGGGRSINSGLFNHPHPSEREINHPKQEDQKFGPRNSIDKKCLHKIQTPAQTQY